MIGLIGWAVIVTAGLAWEAWAIRRNDKEWPTLTDVIRHAPKWLIAPALGWLVWHFLGGQ